MTTPVRLHPVNVRNYGSQSRLTLPDIKVAGWTLCTTRQDFEQLAIVRTHKGTRHFVSPHLIRDWDVSDFLGRPEISPLCHVKGESQPIKRYKLVDWLFRSTLSIHRVNHAVEFCQGCKTRFRQRYLGMRWSSEDIVTQVLPEGYPGQPWEERCAVFLSDPPVNETQSENTRTC